MFGEADGVTAKYAIPLRSVLELAPFVVLTTVFTAPQSLPAA
jgi:hypothetical protein